MPTQRISAGTGSVGIAWRQAGTSDGAGTLLPKRGHRLKAGSGGEARESWAYGATGSTSTDLIAQNASQAHAAENVSLGAGPSLDISDAAQAHAAEALALTLDTTLAAQDAQQGHAAENVVFTLGNVSLAVQDAVQVHRADNVGEPEARFGGFEMVGGVPTVSRKPLLQRILDERAEAKAVTLPNKEKRRKARLIETIAAKVAMADESGAETRFRALLDQWKALKPEQAGEQLRADDALHVFRALVAAQVQRLQDEDDEEAVALLML